MKKVLRRKDESIQWTALLFDLLGAYIITAISLFVLALLLYRFQITKSVIGVGIILTYLVSCFFAGNRAGKKMKQKRFLDCVVKSLMRIEMENLRRPFFVELKQKLTMQSIFLKKKTKEYTKT